MEEYQFDPSLNVFFRRHRELDFLFFPKNVALIGATDKENSVGKTVLLNLLNTNFGGKVYPVNPRKEEILGIKAYSDVRNIPVDIDLAVIVTPAKTVPEIINQCSEKKIPTAVIISAGFKELGEKGKNLEEEVLKNAKKTNMRIVGPNCLGVMNTVSGLNATFASSIALKGDLAFISQSGALCAAVLDWSLKEKVGFSSFISIGSMADVDWGDLISYLGTDPHTKSILIYMESIGDPRAFLSAAREAALTKPIILIKAGVTEESAKAAASHTGSLAGSNDVFNAALERVGVLRVETISELFSLAEILAKQPLPKGPNLTIITNAGGPGVIATDALIKNGGKPTPVM
jgi:acetyltransferase